MTDLTNGCPKCKRTKFTEHIDKGISQEVKYDNGSIVTEVTIYDKDVGYVTCDNCHERWDAYKL